MLQKGKVDNIKQEIKMMKINVVGFLPTPLLLETHGLQRMKSVLTNKYI